MDSWLNKIGESVQKHAETVRTSAEALTTDLLSNIDGNAELTFDYSFEAGPLGFQIEGSRIVSIERGSQAATLGVKIGDRLTAVAGYEVPAPPPGDQQGELRAKRLIKKWIKEAPRPVRLSFMSPDTGDNDAALDAAFAAEEEEGAAAADPEEAAAQAALEQQAAQVLGLFDATFSSDAAPSPERSLGRTGPPPPEPELQPGGGSASFLTEAPSRAPPPILPEVAPAPAFAAQPAEVSPPAPIVVVGEEDDLRLSDQAALHEAHYEIAALRAELRRAEDQRKRAASELLSERQAWAQRSGVLEEERKANAEDSAWRQLAEVTSQLRESRAAAEELRVAAKTREDELECLREGSEGATGVLEDELRRLRERISTAESACREAQRASSDAEAQAEELRLAADREIRSARELLARATSAEGRAEAAEWQLGGVRETHRTEIEALQVEHRQLVTSLEVQIAEHEEERRLAPFANIPLVAAMPSPDAAAAADVEDAEDEEDEDDDEGDADIMAALADLESCAPSWAEVAVPPALAAPSPNRPEAEAKEPQELVVLRERLELLERRCQIQQKKLNARPIVFQGKRKQDPGDQKPVWEPILRALGGDRAADVALQLHGGPDRALRRFTQSLLDHDTWLWVFYIHLLALYAIVSFSYYEVEVVETDSPVDAINAAMEQAQSSA